MSDFISHQASDQAARVTMLEANVRLAREIRRRVALNMVTYGAHVVAEALTAFAGRELNRAEVDLSVDAYVNGIGVVVGENLVLVKFEHSPVGERSRAARSRLVELVMNEMGVPLWHIL
jgi:hypothetical protein